MNAAALSPSELLEALTRLPEEEFQTLVCRASVRRHPPKTSLSERESELLMLINVAPSAEWTGEMERLRDVGRARVLTAAEEQALERVVGALEDHAAARLRHLMELAGIRGISLEELMTSLGLKSASHA